MNAAKRLFALVLIIGVLFSFSSCGGDNEYMGFLKNGWSGETETPTETSKDGTTSPKDESPTEASTKKSSNITTTKSVATTTQKQYTIPELLSLYKAAANSVKTSSGVTCTRTKEVITTISGSIPGNYQSFGFRPGTNDKKEVYNTKEDVNSNFCVERKSYVCDLSNSDIKDAVLAKDGNNAVITILVKDDTAGTYDRSSKCVSTINLSDGSWTCKGVTIKGTINAKGKLVALYYSMPTYVTTSSSSFAFSVEQYWDIAY